MDLENVKSQLRVFLIPGEGNIIINKISGNKYYNIMTRI
jgi:ribosomal protein S9